VEKALGGRKAGTIMRVVLTAAARQDSSACGRVWPSPGRGVRRAPLIFTIMTATSNTNIFTARNHARSRSSGPRNRSFPDRRTGMGWAITMIAIGCSSSPCCAGSLDFFAGSTA